LLTFFVFVIGHFSGDLKALSATANSAAARAFFAVCYYALPNLAKYNYITPAAHGLTPAGRTLLACLAYALVYVGVLLAATTLIFRRRNLK
jgi:hypothetical protein